MNIRSLASIVTIVLLSSCLTRSRADERLVRPQLTNRFYTMSENRLIWTGPDANSERLRAELIQWIDSAASFGLDKDDYHYSYIKRELRLYNDISADKIFTDAALSFAGDLYGGKMQGNMLGYDGVKPRYQARQEDYLLKQLLEVQDAGGLNKFISSLEPVSQDYLLLKQELATQRAARAGRKIDMLEMSLNYYRKIHNYHFKQCIVVNICNASLNYYENDKVMLNMKVVVGKPKTKTPRFTAFCYEAIMYPYWNVPTSIAVKEILPKYRRNRAALNSLNLQVVDSRGHVVDPSVLAGGLGGYRLRQSTGCDNALGVLKFNISDPYSVYMHDTDYKNAFKLRKRYLSHGCIRLEKPLELGDYLLPGKINKSLLQACVKSQTPTTVKIADPVPVFVIYMPADVENGSVIYYDDIYRFLR